MFAINYLVSFYKIHKFLDFSSKVLFHNSYILPRIDYCLSICGDAPMDTLLRLFRLQKRVARLILDVDNDTSSAIVFRQIKWMSIFQMYLFYQKCILLFNIVNDFSPQYLKKLFVYVSQNSLYNLRNTDQCILNVPFPKLLIFGTCYHRMSGMLLVYLFLN